MLRVLLNRYHEGATESVLEGLPKESSQKVLEQNIDALDPSKVLVQPVNKIKQIHYSWFISSLKKLSKNKRALALSVFPEPQATKLIEVLNETLVPLRQSVAIRTFLLNRLYPDFKLPDVLPVDYLPPSELTQLVKMKKAEIINLIDFLGLYDLAEEIRHIVDKKLLEKIYRCLSQRKHRFMRICLHQKEKLITQKLQLEHWDGDCQKLGKLLHHRGMVRLGYALSGQHQDLVWHIVHILDAGRGNKLTRYYHKSEIPGVSKALRSQSLAVMHFFKERAKS